MIQARPAGSCWAQPLAQVSRRLVAPISSLLGQNGVRPPEFFERTPGRAERSEIVIQTHRAWHGIDASPRVSSFCTTAGREECCLGCIGASSEIVDEHQIASRAVHQREQQLAIGRQRLPCHHGFPRSTIVVREPVANPKKSIDVLCRASPALIAGLALSSTGQHELAVAETEKAIALDPDWAPAYTNRAFHQLMLNRLDDALLTVRLAAERKLESANLLLTQYFVAFLTGNENELIRTVTAARKSPATEDSISHIEALALARSGRLQDARRMAAVAVQIAEKSGRRERAGLFEAATAVWEAFYGNAAAARQSATRALELGRGGREVDYAAAFALALAGDLPQSRTLAEDLAREFPEDTSVQFMYLPTLRAPVLIEQSDS